MNANQKIHQANLARWAVRFKEQADSGLTVKDWCDANSFTIHTYNYWKHLFKEEYVDAVMPDIVPIAPLQTTPVSSLPSIAGFHSRPQTLSGESHNSCEPNNTNLIRITIGDIRIEISEDTASETICRIIKAVRYA